MVDLQKEITQFLEQCKQQKVNENYFEKQLSNNTKVWVQWYFEDFNIELQLKTDKQKDFEDYCININNTFENNTLNKYIKEQLKQITQIGITNYIKQNKEHFL